MICPICNQSPCVCAPRDRDAEIQRLATCTCNVNAQGTGPGYCPAHGLAPHHAAAWKAEIERLTRERDHWQGRAMMADEAHCRAIDRQIEFTEERDEARAELATLRQRLAVRRVVIPAMKCAACELQQELDTLRQQLASDPVRRVLALSEFRSLSYSPSCQEHEQWFVQIQTGHYTCSQGPTPEAAARAALAAMEDKNR